MADNKMVLLVLKRIGEKIEAEKEYLTELDQPIGDSDHGINLARGFQEVENKLPSMEDKDINGKMDMDMNDFLGAVEAAVEAVKQRGKATVEEATMLDAMVPALDAMKQAAADGMDRNGVLEAGCKASWAGAEHTKDLVATKGRASYVGERGLGHQDPGATSFSFMLETVKNTLN